MLEDPHARNRGPRRGKHVFFAYLSLVIALGWTLIVWSLSRLSGSDFKAMGAGFALMATFVLLAEMRPLLVAGSPDSNGVTITTCFVFAMLFHWGLPVAILVQTVATLVGDRAQRRVWWRMAFNTAQYAVSWAAAGVVLSLAGAHGTPHIPADLKVVDVWVIVAAAMAYFLVNDIVVGEAIALLTNSTLLREIREDFGFQLLSSGALLALAPFVVLALASSVWLVPLLLVPLLAVYKNASVSREQEYQSLHDSLTGLPNRKYLLRDADEALDAARQDGTGIALCLLDLDRFKEVNDTLGHQVGDRLLQLVATRLSAAVRPTDTVARLGGDEFAVMFREVDAEEAEVLVRRLLAAFEDVFAGDGMFFDLDVSIGVALHPQHSDTFESLLRRADVAMYLAKNDRGGFRIYDPALDRHSTERLALLGELRRALDDGQLVLHYQPKAALATGEVVGVEALARWYHPVRGLVPTDVFVPLAEQTGLMRPLTDHVVRVAVSQIAAWRAAGIFITVAINISVRDLHDPQFAVLLRETCEREGVPPTALQLEITEGTLIDDPTRTEDVLRELAAFGVALSLDDFGTGYSSLRHLKRLPVKEIKIDRSFVQRLHIDADDAAIVRSIIDLGEALGLRVVAEGVETLETWHRLAAMGCDEAQGWYLARPMAAANATSWLLNRLAVPEQATAASRGAEITA
ncbi:cyclic Di-GMP phosphodiesterase RmdB [Acidothermaceae bacterium B102]|nr:cyclic Di-GMP phosphodiesterase RmdB [Acidothermaceae bacterium B102]